MDANNGSFNKPPGSQSDPFYDLLYSSNPGTAFGTASTPSNKTPEFAPSFESNGSESSYRDYGSSQTRDYSIPSAENQYTFSSAKQGSYPSESLRTSLPNSRFQVEEDRSDYDRKTAAAVETTMKTYADKLLKLLDGMNGRLQHLETTVIHLETVVGKFQQSVANENGEIDGKLRNLETLVRDIQRGVQVIRDRQEIFEAQSELAKLAGQSSANNANQQPQASVQPLSAPPSAPAPSAPPAVASPPPPIPPTSSSAPAPIPPVQSSTASSIHLPTSVPVPPSAPAPAPVPVPSPVMPQATYYQPPYSEMNQSIQPSAPLPPVVSDPSAHPQPGGHMPVPTSSEKSPYLHVSTPQYQAPVNMSQMYPPQASSMGSQQPGMVPPQQGQYQSPTVPNLPQSAPPRPEALQHSQKPGSPAAGQYLQHEGAPSYILSQPSYPNSAYPPIPDGPGYGNPNGYGQPQYPPVQNKPEPPNRAAAQPGFGQGYEPVQRANRLVSSQLALPAPYPSTQSLGHGSSSYDSPQGMYGREPPSQYRLAQPVPSREGGGGGGGGGGGYPKLPLAQPVQRSSDTYSSPLVREGAGGPPSGSARSSVDKVIDDVANMGFPKDQVRGVVRKLTDNDQPVDLNTVLDKLMNGDRGRDNKGAWFGRG